MPQVLHAQPLYRSEIVSINDVRCRPHTPDCGGEEWSAAHGIAFVRNGLFIKHVGSVEVVADTNQVVFFNRNQPYRVGHPVAGGDDCTSFQFPTETAVEIAARYDPAARDRPGEPFSVAHAPIVRDAFVFHHHLRRGARGTTCNGLAIDECALQLLDAVLQAAHRVRGIRRPRCRSDTLRAHQELVTQVQVFLTRHLADRPSLDRIAHAVHASAFHLSRVFRHLTGLAIYKYLSRLRLRLALQRLADGETNLTRLALDLGYSSHAHLTDAFRKEFGLPPSALRRQLTRSRWHEMSKKLEV